MKNKNIFVYKSALYFIYSLWLKTSNETLVVIKLNGTLKWNTLTKAVIIYYIILYYIWDCHVFRLNCGSLRVKPSLDHFHYWLIHRSISKWTVCKRWGRRERHNVITECVCMCVCVWVNRNRSEFWLIRRAAACQNTLVFSLKSTPQQLLYSKLNQTFQTSTEPTDWFWFWFLCGHGCFRNNMLCLSQTLLTNWRLKTFDINTLRWFKRHINFIFTAGDKQNSS